MTFGSIYLGVFVILIWAFLLSSNLGAGYRYKFWPVSAPEWSTHLLVIISFVTFYVSFAVSCSFDQFLTSVQGFFFTPKYFLIAYVCFQKY